MKDIEFGNSHGIEQADDALHGVEPTGCIQHKTSVVETRPICQLQGHHTKLIGAGSRRFDKLSKSGHTSEDATPLEGVYSYILQTLGIDAIALISLIELIRYHSIIQRHVMFNVHVHCQTPWC